MRYIKKFWIILSVINLILLTSCTTGRNLGRVPEVSEVPLSHEQKILIILPLSDKKSAISKNIMAAVELVYENHKEQLKEKNIGFKFLDYNDPNLANKIEAIKPLAILGPIFSHQTAFLSDKINKNFKIYSFSNDATLAKNNNIYVTGISPFYLLEKVMEEEAIKGKSKFFIVGARTQVNLDLINYFNKVKAKYPELVLVKLELHNNTIEGRNYATIAMADSLKALGENNSTLIVLEPQELKVEEIIENLREHQVDFTKFDIFIPFMVDGEKLDRANPFLADIYVPVLKDMDDLKVKYYDKYNIMPENISIIAYDLLLEILGLTQEGSKFIIDSAHDNILRRRIEFEKLINQFE
ncbi:type 1 periplasmic-binding domain-containing protein [Rickettsiales endosymbiont of Stachyamoeba lipophora]|uniref:hypothetical protein n=1 Tax=Rickettsiales endosymbiont of Stachyamoeba lipophora TaxID=2486578 RepID=UPI000F64F1D2|nr:hypothetical protein [Rickettsiales endosymbiont of Stachyamoeba lipophora]AZL16137.1 hypothetical protein EF513_06285 [Rickettsiales endosymbiont of Stachyamoeba lipophora]